MVFMFFNGLDANLLPSQHSFYFQIFFATFLVQKTFCTGGGQTISDKTKNKNEKKIKEKNKKGRKLALNLIFVTNTMCKELFFLKSNKSCMLSKTTYSGIFISFMSCKMIRVELFFYTLRSYPFPLFY